LRYPDGDRESGAVYGKVTGVVPAGGARRTRIHLTSVDPVDQAALGGLRERASASSHPTAVSNAPEASA
jgi:hypothetical protein